MVAVTTPVTLALPATSNLDVGLEVPIPKLPVDGTNANSCGVIFNNFSPVPSTNAGKFTVEVVEAETLTSGSGVFQKEKGLLPRN